ncbi:MAG: hypothetical protein Q8L78_01365 [Coxiellaceae bacterium]|nr:hypothetical protein [Coxiellaceae bacterium]
MLSNTEESSLLTGETGRTGRFRLTADEVSAFLVFSAKNAPYFILDTLRIYCITQVLMQRLTYQILIELKDNYRETLPDHLKMSASFNAMLLFAPAAALTLLAKARNIYKKHQSGGGNNFYERVESGKYSATEASIFALLSGSQGLMLFDLLSSVAKGVDDPAVKLPFWAFCLTASMGFMSLTALFFKLVFPDTSDRLIMGRFNELSAPFYPVVRRGERVLNGLSGLISISAVSAAVWEVNRERNNGTVASSMSELVAMATIAAASIVMGAITTTDFPKLFHLFVMASKFIYGGAMAAAAFSGHAYFMLDNPAESAKLPLYMTGWVTFSAMIATFNALITHYRFEEVHKANLWMLITLERLACCKKDGVDDEQVDSSTRASVQVYHPGDTATARASLATTPCHSRCGTLGVGEREGLGEELVHAYVPM